MLCNPCLQSGQRGDVYCCGFIWWRYARSVGDLFARSWERVRRVCLGSCVSDLSMSRAMRCISVFGVSEAV